MTEKRNEDSTPRGRSEGTRGAAGAVSLRELLLIAVIVALVVFFFVRPTSPKADSTQVVSKALYSVDVPIQYRYWLEVDGQGSGTGAIGSGNEWRNAKGIEGFDEFVILHLDGDVDRMVELVGMKWFDWKRVDSSPTLQPTPLSSH